MRSAGAVTLTGQVQLIRLVPRRSEAPTEMEIAAKFARHSSPVDWCEGNYQISLGIAEFYNTVSNVLFFVFPPLLIHLFRRYAREVNFGVNVVWVMLIIVGAGSVYFHATLSLVGQLLDELAILWAFMAGFAIWCPDWVLPPGLLDNDRIAFKWAVLVFTVVSSAMACVVPAVNAFVLICLGVPTTVLLIAELKRCRSKRVYYLGLRCCLMWVIALSSWVSDRVFCDMWASLDFPYLHSVWHIFIFLATYQACVLFAFFDAQVQVPEQMPVVLYWPEDSWGWVGIPYVTFKKPSHSAYPKLC